MVKFFKVAMCVMVMSFSIFPFVFSFFPAANTKMIMAAMGLAVWLFNISKERSGIVDRGFAIISLWAFGVSAVSFASITINNTPDTSYVGYLISMWVWLGAAYFSVQCIKNIDGVISVERVIWILIGVAVFQCFAGILMYKYSFWEDLFKNNIQGEKYMGIGIDDTRLHGIGCALDVGGARLGAILIAISYLIIQYLKRNISFWIISFLIASFIFITVCGNMMGRTLTIGASLAVLFILVNLLFNKELYAASKRRFILWSSIILLGGILSCVVLYNSDSSSKELLRFGFEGFFNYFESGTFETHSTNLLSQGLIFPDNWHTWLIGDGYMMGGANDPYYIGPEDYGFYMNTDSGYSRFIFYFGIIGLSTFMGFFINVAIVCSKRLPKAKFLFLLLLILNFVIWIKVSSDIFMIFAPFLCISKNEEIESESRGLAFLNIGRQ